MESETQLVNAPVMPLAGDADPLAVLVPAEAIVNEEEKNSSKTSATDSKTTIVASDSEKELQKLCDEADAKATELLTPYHALQVRISGELFPILLRIKNLLPHGEWGLWYGNFCTRHHITTSLRTVQRAFADLTDNRLLTDGKPTQKSPANAAVAAAADLLASAKEQLGKSAAEGSEQAKAHIQQYEKAYTDAVAAAAKEPASTAATANVKPSAETRVNRRLAAMVEAGERYIRVIERVVYSEAVTLTDRQKKDIEKAAEPWRKVLRDARELTWAIKTIERQEEEGA